MGCQQTVALMAEMRRQLEQVVAASAALEIAVCEGRAGILDAERVWTELTEASITLGRVHETLRGPRTR